MNDDREKSRTQLKKEAMALQNMGQRLVDLSDDQLDRMALPADLMAAVREIRGMKSHGARRRQLQYIGAVMRRIDTGPIEQALMEIDQGAYRQARAFQRIEAWRDRLVDGDDALIDEILETFAQADRQRLGQLVRSARKERQNEAPPKSARNLFRYLKSLSEG
jgi:ribosome-associated protein